ncbi:hypothetical protein FKG94_01370 [Exilibacterium tricleocarpae]|uniref:Uncharacterized protein n=1 Tax=Exilibacterium tricleocarpae TaxID=2591008 RepID=A0A545U9X1_9GAMM|nr:hypothetical protein [Exilibacterium tricleocarpae]TQV86229.1 hypothetical protein FKG94_01370 [Exilibacterium tricleocarpae]
MKFSTETGLKISALYPKMMRVLNKGLILLAYEKYTEMIMKRVLSLTKVSLILCGILSISITPLSTAEIVGCTNCLERHEDTIVRSFSKACANRFSWANGDKMQTITGAPIDGMFFASNHYDRCVITAPGVCSLVLFHTVASQNVNQNTLDSSDNDPLPTPGGFVLPPGSTSWFVLTDGRYAINGSIVAFRTWSDTCITDF